MLTSMTVITSQFNGYVRSAGLCPADLTYPNPLLKDSKKVSKKALGAKRTAASGDAGTL
jgi:hypothetical protein